MTGFGEKIKKIGDELYNMSIKEIGELEEYLKESYNIEPFTLTAVANNEGSNTTSNQNAEKSSFNVILKEVGDNKIGVIKAVKETLSLGLTEAKAFVDSAPKEIKTNVPRDEANSIKEKLEAAGATVELQ